MITRRTIGVVAGVVLLGTSAVAIGISAAASGTSQIAVPTSGATYVSSNSKGTNYNNASLLTASSSAFRALVQFTPGLPVGATLISAGLSIDPALSGSGSFVVHPEGSFSPTSVTWSNQPSFQSAVLGSSRPTTAGVSQTISLTGLSLAPTIDLSITYSPSGVAAKLHNPGVVLELTYSVTGGTTTTTTVPATTTTSATSTTTTTVPATTTTTSTSTPSTTSTTTSTPTTTTTRPSATGHKVLVILEENHSQSEALASMPHLTAYANQYGSATGYSAVSHPSLPNYVAIWSGSTQGITSDCGVGTTCLPAPPSAWGQTLAAGRTARAYQESMTTNCQTASGGGYVARHSPWPYFSDSTERSGCLTNDVPMGTTTSGNLLNDINSGNLPVTGEMTPNLNDNAHDGTLAQADTWLSGWLPVIMAGPDYTSGNLTIIVTFDEDDSTQENAVQFVAIDPRLSHVVVSGPFNHYSLTRWLEDNAGVALLRNAATAPDLRSAFGL